MKAKVYDINNKEIDTVTLKESVFGLEVRPDLIKRVIDWQRAKAMAGTHKTKTVSEVSGTTKKPFKQKGTGNARQGSLRSAQMRGGGVPHGPQVRSHAIKLQKKVRKLGLCHALSSKISDNKLFILNNIDLENNKTKSLNAFLSKFEGKSFFIIGSDVLNDNVKQAAMNLSNVVAVPQIGANVYDIIKHDVVIIAKDAIKTLEERLTYAVL
jgi:large subunit ribosomal protein L4